ncbi:MAG: DUF359 domain-containing protein [Candidatus Marsarchaeota archaeon]|nr:DUF359 domain-containing protein [Candidatus Marsarchaeota archaeon]
MGELIPSHLVDSAMNQISGDELIVVGDVVSATAMKLGISPYLALIDGRTERRRLPEQPLPSARTLKAHNPPGTITLEAVCTIMQALTRVDHSIIAIEGEEDLLTIPVVLLARNGVNIVYGQPGKGVVKLMVDSTLRQSVLNIFKQFNLAFYE